VGLAPSGEVGVGAAHAQARMAQRVGPVGWLQGRLLARGAASAPPQCQEAHQVASMGGERAFVRLLKGCCMRHPTSVQG